MTTNSNSAEAKQSASADCVSRLVRGCAEITHGEILSEGGNVPIRVLPYVIAARKGCPMMLGLNPRLDLHHYEYRITHHPERVTIEWESRLVANTTNSQVSEPKSPDNTTHQKQP